VRRLAQIGAPIAAECAGLLYLSRSLDDNPMVGAIDADAVMGPRLTLGYREAVALTDSVLAVAGTRVRGHEFHRTVCRPRSGPQPAWQWQGQPPEGFVAGNLHASYLHLHWAGLPGAARRFVDASMAVQATVHDSTAPSPLVDM
jgi:cobyrinic acid a,c-diamide synthase